MTRAISSFIVSFDKTITAFSNFFDWSASPYINRFLSADTIVPSYANPQSLNRYSYVLNNPLRYVDPTGHRPVNDHEGKRGCSDPDYCRNGRPKPYDELNPSKSPEKPEKEERQNLCTGTAPYKPAFTCGGVVTEPGIVIPSSSDDPVVGGYTSDGNINYNYVPPNGFDIVSALIDGLTWVHYNTSAYSTATGANARAAIPFLHHNESGLNYIPGIGVINNTGMDLSVVGVLISNRTIPVSRSASIPNGNMGAVQFSNPVALPNTNISVQINFLVTTSSGVFGTGQINYDGPNYPVYGPPAP